MGITTSTVEAPLGEDTTNSAGGSGDSVVPVGNNTKSATVIVVGMTEPELVADIDIADIVGFEARKRGATRGKGASVPFSFGSGFPGGSGAPGGGGIRPDEVAASFTLANVGGLETEIEYLKRAVILPIAQPSMLKEWGVEPPKGILLHGPPGCGKTFVAKSLVNEIKKATGRPVNFFYRKGGDCFSMWYGESQQNLRNLFDAAKAMAPSVIFFDELDGLCPSRDGGNHGTEAYNSIVTCFLGQMDSLEAGKVFVVGATNRLDTIDPAVRRPGRFDKHLAFAFPDEQGRHKILTIHTNKWASADRPSDQVIKNLAKKTIGFSGADLEKLCKDVVYVAIQENQGVITKQMKVKEHHWEQALNSMRRTDSSSFGSNTMSPTRPPEVVSTLIQPLVEAAVQKIQPLIGSTSSNSPTFRKNLVLTITEQQSKSFLNNQILQGILSEPLFNKMTVYDLSMESIQNKITSGRKHTVLTVVHEVITQALDSTSPAVILLPSINEIVANPSTKYQLISAFSKIRGPNVFLLATSSQPLSLIPEPQFREIFAGFGRTMTVENPKRDHLIKFFNTLPNNGQLPVGRMKQVVEDAANVSDNDNFEDILNLYNALAMNLTEGGDTIDMYKQNKLR